MVAYPSFERRFLALMIDGPIILLAAAGTILIITRFGLPAVASAVVTGVIILMLEPFLVSISGGTIGHHLLGVRVRQKYTDKKINFTYATIRFFTKLIFGIFSLATYNLTKSHQTIHDYVSVSVVVLKNPAS